MIASGFLKLRQNIDELKAMGTKFLMRDYLHFMLGIKSECWRFREAILDLPLDNLQTHKEGRTSLYQSSHI